jgi:hypothetical protein
LYAAIHRPERLEIIDVSVNEDVGGKILWST